MDLNSRVFCISNTIKTSFNSTCEEAGNRGFPISRLQAPSHNQNDRVRVVSYRGDEDHRAFAINDLVALPKHNSGEHK